MVNTVAVEVDINFILLKPFLNINATNLAFITKFCVVNFQY